MTVLIDDHSSVRQGVVNLIRALPGFRVLDASAEIKQALHTVGKKRPALVLVNLRREGDDSLTLACALHGKAPESRVIMMGSKPLQEDVMGLVRARVSGFIMADASFYQFLSTIHLVAQGIQVLPLQLAHTLFGQLNEFCVPRPPRRVLGIKRLTSRVEVTAWPLQSSSFELDRFSPV